MRIPLSRPDIGEREIEYVTRVLKTGQLSLGPALAEFEWRFAEYAGTCFAIATNSGTSALHLCVRALGIGAGDEVLTPSFSFVASVNCLLYEGATPVFVDIDPATLNIDPKKIRECIGQDYAWDREHRQLVNRRTGRLLKAILPVHVFGLPCDMRAILTIAREFNLRVIEDACEALGAESVGRRVGTFGEAAAFAFYPNKQMTTAEGGMVVTNDANVAKLCRSMRNQGRDEDGGWLRHERVGFNYRLSDLHCALGLAQLERIEELLAGRARVARAYARELAEVPGIRLPKEAAAGTRSWFVYVIQTEDDGTPHTRDRLIAELRERGIGCQAYFPPIHEQPYLQDGGLELGPVLPHTQAASRTSIALPFFASMTAEQVGEVCAAVREILAAGADHYAQADSESASGERARVRSARVGASAR
jgi:perosamine synthetase